MDDHDIYPKTPNQLGQKKQLRPILSILLVASLVGRRARIQNMQLSNFNVFAADGPFCVDDGLSKTKLKYQPEIRILLLSFPSFISFFGNHSNARYDSSHPKYTNSHTKWQGEVFEKITGKSDTNNVFTQVRNNFSGEFPGFFVKENFHNRLLA